MLYASVHVDPGAGWFPHYAGFADEVGVGAGAGANLNLPLAPGTQDMLWLDAIRKIVQRVIDFGATALVLSLGADAAADDPESPLEITLTATTAPASCSLCLSAHGRPSGGRLPPADIRCLGAGIAAGLDSSLAT